MLLTAVLAAEEGAEGIELLPDQAELIWGIVAFLLLMAAMFKLVFPKLNQTLEERGRSIQGRMEEAEAKLTEAEEARRRYEAAISDAQGEANRIIEEAKSTGESLRADIVAKAEAEAEQIVDRARREVVGERDRALQELRGQVGNLSVELAARIVEKELDAAAHEHLVDEYIQRLSSDN